MMNKSITSSSQDTSKWEIVYPVKQLANTVRRPLIADDIAQAALYMLKQPMNISVKAMDVVPSGKS